MSGIYAETSGDGPIDQARAYERLDALKHRGPESYRIALFNQSTAHLAVGVDRKPDWDSAEAPNVFVGQQRLIVTDPGDQPSPPMANRDGSLVLSWDGAILNPSEIREALGSAGRDLASSDELILEAYEKWGPEFVKRLRGPFAIVILDRRLGRLFLARDHVGQKPLYYQINSQGACVSSELTPLLHRMKHKIRIDELEFARFLTFSYIPYDGSLFEGIRKLPPAHYALIDLPTGRIDRHEYWDLDGSEDAQLSADEHRERVDAAMREAVRCCLVPGESSGIFASGGIDSSLVAKYAAEASEKPMLFHADFPDGDQREWIDQVSSHYGLPLSVSMCKLVEFKQGETTFDLLDEPHDSGCESAAEQLFREAASIGTRVMLSGDGSDELFGGYAGHRLYLEKLRKIQSFRSLTGGKLGLALAERMFRLGFKLKDGRGMTGGRRALVLAHLVSEDLARGFQLASGMYGLYRMMDSAPSLDRILEFADVQLANQPYQDARAFQYVDLKGVMPCKQAYRIDRLGMRRSIETRCPFADHRLTELAFRIPSSHLIVAGRGKVLLKDILQADLGERFVNRKKSGFHNSRDIFFCSEGAKNALLPVTDRERPLHRYLDKDALRQRFKNLDEPASNDRTSRRSLWRLLALATYIEHHADVIDMP